MKENLQDRGSKGYALNESQILTTSLAPKLLKPTLEEPLGNSDFDKRFSYSNFGSRPSSSFVQHRPSTALKLEEKLALPGNTLVVESDRLSMETTVGSTASAMLQVFNNTAKSITLEWERVRTSNLISDRKKPSAGPAVSGLRRVSSSLETRTCFRSVLASTRSFIIQNRVNLLPGQTVDFSVCFFSRHPGVFVEKWRLVPSSTSTKVVLGRAGSPLLKNFELVVSAIVTNPFDVQKATEILEREFQDKEKYRFAESIICNILETKVRPPHEVALPTKRKLVSDDEDLFSQRNREFRLFYSVQIFQSFKDMYLRVRSLQVTAESDADVTWDGSVMTVYNSISQVPDSASRGELFAQWNLLFEQASKVPETLQTSLTYVICYDLLVELAHSVSFISENCLKQLGLPLKRPCLIKFTSSFRSPFQIASGMGSNLSVSNGAGDRLDDSKANNGAAKKSAKDQPVAKQNVNSSKLHPQVKSEKPTGSSSDLRKSALSNNATAQGVPNRIATDNRPSSGHDSQEHIPNAVKAKYSKEFARAEVLYKQNFYGQVRAAVSEKLTRLVDLLQDAACK